jgi:hypothetical protein
VHQCPRLCVEHRDAVVRSALEPGRVDDLVHGNPVLHQYSK